MALLVKAPWLRATALAASRAERVVAVGVLGSESSSCSLSLVGRGAAGRLAAGASFMMQQEQDSRVETGSLLESTEYLL